MDNLELREDVLSPKATLENLGLDSLDKIEFMFALEDEFRIKIPERDVKIVTIQDMVDVIEKLIVEQHGTA